MSTISFTGRLGRDVEVRQAGQSTVAEIAIAVDTGYGERKKTTWYRCQLWGKRAEGGLIPYLTKGAQVFVTGEHSASEYSKKDGTTGHSNDVNIDRVQLVGGNQAGAKSGGNQQQSGGSYGNNGGDRRPPVNQPPPADGFDDEVPF